MKKFKVSIAVRGFAHVTVSAETEAEAKTKAMAADYSELEVEPYTLQSDLVEKVEEAAS